MVANSNNVKRVFCPQLEEIVNQEEKKKGNRGAYGIYLWKQILSAYFFNSAAALVYYA